MQEAARKDVERSFGLLQSRFAIIKGPARLWEKKDPHLIMTACVLLHNMIIEDEREECFSDDGFSIESPFSLNASTSFNNTFDNFLQKHREIQSPASHFQLRNDIIEHLWQKKREEE
jgi:hypothetical protein